MTSSLFRTLLFSLLLGGLGQASLAQVANPALTEAKRRLACGAGIPISAVYLPGGAVKVTCQLRGTEAIGQAAANSLPQTGLAASPTAGAILSTFVLVAITNDDSGSNTTTTTAAQD